MSTAPINYARSIARSCGNRNNKKPPAGGLLWCVSLSPGVKAVAAFRTADILLSAAPVQPQQCPAMRAFEILILSHPADATAKLLDPGACVLIMGKAFKMHKLFSWTQFFQISKQLLKRIYGMDSYTMIREMWEKLR